MRRSFARWRELANAAASSMGDPYQRLAHMVIAQAMDDTERGDPFAKAFLFSTTFAPDLEHWAGLLGVSPSAIRSQFLEAQHG